MLVTPLVELGSQQVDYVKSARRLGVRSALSVASWDNLTSKGLIRVLPDHVIVWNDAQRAEAAALHHVPDGARRGHRRAALRRVVRGAAQPIARRLLSRGRPRPGQAVRALRGLVELHRARGSALRRALAVAAAPGAERGGRAGPACSSARIPPTRASGARSRRRRSRRCRCGRRSAPSRTGHRPGATTWTRCGTARRWWASTPAPRSKRPSSAVRSSRSATRTSRTRRAARCTSGISWTGADPCAWPTRSTPTCCSWVSSWSESPRRRRRRVSSCGTSFARTAWTARPRPSTRPPSAGLCALPRRAPEPDPWWIVALRPLGLAKAFLAHLLSEDRPLWVYAMRPFLAVAVWLMTAAHGPARRLAGARAPWREAHAPRRVAGLVRVVARWSSTASAVCGSRWCAVRAMREAWRQRLVGKQA